MPKYKGDIKSITLGGKEFELQDLDGMTMARTNSGQVVTIQIKGSEYPWWRNILEPQKPKLSPEAQGAIDWLKCPELDEYAQCEHMIRRDKSQSYCNDTPRETPEGLLCLEHWLGLAVCDICGETRGSTRHDGKNQCRKCYMGNDETKRPESDAVHLLGRNRLEGL